jgi:arylformamidase
MFYKHYDEEALNCQYNNRLQVPDYALHTETWERLSRQTEKEYLSISNIAYGELAREQLDIYPSSKPNSKTLVFIHGGYWRNMDKRMFHFVAKAFHQYNVTTILITYPLAPLASIDQVVSSCRKAVNWVQQNISQHNGNPGKMYISGHSAGGHLAAMMMTADEKYFMPGIKGVCSISGLFNLVPIQLSEINETLQMDNAMALRNSPVLLRSAGSCPLLLAVGINETEEYKAQSEELYKKWKEEIPLQLLQLRELNHYSIIEDLLNTDSLLHQKMCELMNI